MRLMFMLHLQDGDVPPFVLHIALHFAATAKSRHFSKSSSGMSSDAAGVSAQDPSGGHPWRWMLSAACRLPVLYCTGIRWIGDFCLKPGIARGLRPEAPGVADVYLAALLYPC